MNAFQRLQNAYFEWRYENQVPDHECILIKVTHSFRQEVLREEVRGAYWMEQDGRRPKERIFGCPMESVRDGEIDGDYEFVRSGNLEFKTDPHPGGAD